MQELTALSRVLRRNRWASFTLIELLTTMAIIAILIGLTIAALSGMLVTAGRNRATAEIQAMGSALDAYKTDNGIYPPSDGTLLLTNTTYASFDGTSINYKTNSQLLYRALSGKTN